MEYLYLHHIFKPPDMDISYILNHLGEDEGFDGFHPVSPPIFQTSNFYFSTVEEFREAIASERDHRIYSRGNNPTVDLLCRKIAALEDTEAALVFASGMAAISCAILANVKSGDHIVCIESPYSWTDTLMTKNILPKFNVQVTMVDGSDPLNILHALRENTRVIYLESPNSWTFEMQDLEAVAAIARQREIITIIDNSYSTPLYQQPCKWGIDLVVHTASKYLSGHSDTVAGICCGSKVMIDKIFHNEFLTLGGIVSPFNAWLILRGLRTLHVRLERIANTTAKLLDFLTEVPEIERIYYPFHNNNPQSDLARRQMKNASGLFTIQWKNRKTESIERFCNSLKYWKMAVSWGGYESLIIPSCTFVRPELYSRLPDNLVRFSVGLEEAGVLIDDIVTHLALLKS